MPEVADDWNRATTKRMEMRGRKIGWVVFECMNNHYFYLHKIFHAMSKHLVPKPIPNWLLLSMFIQFIYSSRCVRFIQKKNERFVRPKQWINRQSTRSIATQVRAKQKQREREIKREEKLCNEIMKRKQRAQIEIKSRAFLFGLFQCDEKLLSVDKEIC